MEGTTWAALTAALTTAGAIWTWIAFRRRGAVNGLRALGFTLLPAAAWLTGTLEVAVEIAGSVTDWATGLVFDVFTTVFLAVFVLVVARARRHHRASNARPTSSTITNGRRSR